MDETPVDWNTRSIPLGPPAAPTEPAAAEPPTSWTQPPPRPRRRTGLIVGIALAAAMIAAGLATIGVLAFLGRSPVPVPGIQAQTFTVHGTVSISGDCSGFGYDDIRTGTQVVLTDESNKVLAVGGLTSTGSCSWAFTIPDVPVGRKFYGITISHRGTLQYTEGQLREGVALGMGG